MNKFVVPMLESERGWGQKIDGYAGPFDDLQTAEKFADRYNEINNSEDRVPDYYIKALQPIPHTGQKCDYRTDSVLYPERTAIITAYAEALSQLQDAQAKIAALQETCEHPEADGEYGSNTGNYDPSADSYWIDWNCPDCGKKWWTDQSPAFVAMMRK